MPWLIFAIFVYGALALQTGLTALPVWSIQTASMGPISPDLVLILGIYFALWAPPRTAGWVMLVLGVLVDLSTPYAVGRLGQGEAGLVFIVGPAAMGYLVGAYAVMQVRGLLYRQSWVAVAMIVLGVGAIVNVVTVALLWLRGLSWLAVFVGEPLHNWNASDQLLHRFWVVLYTTLAAAILSYPLSRLRRTWGLDTAKTSHAFRH